MASCCYSSQAPAPSINLLSATAVPEQLPAEIRPRAMAACPESSSEVAAHSEGSRVEWPPQPLLSGTPQGRDLPEGSLSSTPGPAPVSQGQPCRAVLVPGEGHRAQAGGESAAASKVSPGGQTVLGSDTPVLSPQQSTCI